jgi:hypothetical protein
VTTSTVVLELRTNNTYDQSTWEIIPWHLQVLVMQHGVGH